VALEDLCYNTNMGDVIRRRLRQTGFASPQEETMLGLLLATGHIRERFEQVCEAHGITGGQYNVLRILRGAGPGGHPRGEVAVRLIERAADVTRLIDRLERQGLVQRIRSDGDQRLSIARITRKGLDLLDRMDTGIQGIHEYIASRLTLRDCRELSRICERLYGD
jgi:DNA-binding MarR family transcriptional regulator